MSLEERTLRKLTKYRVCSESFNARAKLAVNALLRAALETASDNNSEIPEESKQRKVKDLSTKEVFSDSLLNTKITKLNNPHPAKEIRDKKEEPLAQYMSEAIEKPFIIEKHRWEVNVMNSKTDINDQKKAFSSAYMKRNVYKSIIRHMLSYVKRNTTNVINSLKSNGFSMAEIEDAILRLKHFNELEKERGNPKKSQVMLKDISSVRSPCTYILKETLNKMQNDWSEGKLGRISMENLKVYKEVCNYYYSAILVVLN